MIVPKDEIRELLTGGLAEVVRGIPPAVDDVCWVRETPRRNPACRARVVDVWPLQEGGWAVLLERVAETFTVPDRPRAERPTLRLTRAQREQLFGGDLPKIEGVGKAPVEVNETVRLSARVSLRVENITFPPRNDGQMGWKLHYELVDARNPVRLLRRTPPTHREDTDDAGTGDASEESHYTSSPRAAVEDAGEAPPRVWQEIRSRTIGEFDHQRRLARYAADRKDKLGRLSERSKARRRRAA